MDDYSDVSGRIRPAGEQDLESVLRIEKICFGEQWNEVQFEAALKDIFLVFEKEEIIGFLVACYSQLANRGFIMRIAVHPSYRGKGIAKFLMGEALDRLKALHVKDVELNVDIVKTGAIKLYEGFGFKVMRVVSPNYNNNEESYHMMKLSLE